MEPRIQYAKTEDGVSIAFATMGEGTPLVYMAAMPYTHVDAEWRYPELRRFYELIAQRRKVVRFDARGSGLSTRDVADCSFEARLLDLQAVVDGLGLDRFVLAGILGTTRLAIMYATRQPERVSHLVLMDGYVRGSDIYGTSQMKGLLSLLENDWEMFTETSANVGFGWAAGEPARRFAAHLRQCVTQEVAKAYARADERLDIGDVLAQVHTPTLVLHRRSVPFPPMHASTALASQIPNARLAVVEGTWVTMEGVEAIARAIDEFVGEGEEAAAEAEAPEAGAFRTILFTDVESSTALTERLGDAKAREVLRTHERIVREALKAHGGSEVKTMGDGFMASFSSATRALECAIATQRAFAEHNQSAAEPIQVRVGLNAGEPIAEEDNLFGTAVITAARIATKARGGEILTSDTVRGLVAGKGFLFSDRGDTALRGFEDPVRLYEVRWQEA